MLSEEGQAAEERGERRAGLRFGWDGWGCGWGMGDGTGVVNCEVGGPEVEDDRVEVEVKTDIGLVVDVRLEDSGPIVLMDALKDDIVLVVGRVDLGVLFCRVELVVDPATLIDVGVNRERLLPVAVENEVVSNDADVSTTGASGTKTI